MNKLEVDVYLALHALWRSLSTLSCSSFTIGLHISSSIAVDAAHSFGISLAESAVNVSASILGRSLAYEECYLLLFQFPRDGCNKNAPTAPYTLYSPSQPFVQRSRNPFILKALRSYGELLLLIALGLSLKFMLFTNKKNILLIEKTASQ